MINVWRQNRFRGPRRHALGLLAPGHQLSSKAYLPSAQERKKIMGKRPFWFVFGGPNGGDVAIGANQWIELRQVCDSDFTWHSSEISVSVGGGASNPSVRVQVRDQSPIPGQKTKFFSLVGENDSNFAGSGQHQLFEPKLYTFRRGHTVVVKIQNLQGSTNNVQVVLAGVQHE